mmetsp:Transcript_22148/g.51481  ORF Transcript_22148/g.51481 Transcript_22148/m.51481 type:complete len:202 (-) Transcript_22148:228-833(-)
MQCTTWATGTHCALTLSSLRTTHPPHAPQPATASCVPRTRAPADYCGRGARPTRRCVWTSRRILRSPPSNRSTRAAAARTKPSTSSPTLATWPSSARPCPPYRCCCSRTCCSARARPRRARSCSRSAQHRWAPIGSGGRTCARSGGWPCSHRSPPSRSCCSPRPRSNALSRQRTCCSPASCHLRTQTCPGRCTGSALRRRG